MKTKTLFQSGLHNNYGSYENYRKAVGLDPDTNENNTISCYAEDERLNFGHVIDLIADKFEPGVLVGTVGTWRGKFDGYKLINTIHDLCQAIGSYDEIVITQQGRRLSFTLHHHDGLHTMGLRKFSDYGCNKRDRCDFDDFNAYTLKFIKRYTLCFGNVI